MSELNAPYDIVGAYNQDEINGFNEALIDRFLDVARLPGARMVLDAMGGDGNLSNKVFRYCNTHGLALPRVTMLEYSHVQCDIAAQHLKNFPIEIVWGDILKMQSLRDDKKIPPSSFDRVLMKSANHEIPLSMQTRLYRNIYQALVPDGLFINLGFLFDDENERDELREIARTKDSLAGLQMAVDNRHFLTRNEFYERLRRAGFVEIEAAHAFSYVIRSNIVARRYFKTEVVERDSIEFELSQLRAKTMRRKGKIRFEADATVMECPGEITVARRPSHVEENQAIYKKYPYDFLRHIKAHREMITKASAYARPGSRVLDAGCGIGLLAEKVAERTASYLAVDVNAQFVEICRTRLRNLSQVEVILGDLNNLRLEANAVDCIFALNVIYQEDINPPRVLSLFRDALAPGGMLVLSAPKDSGSFERCEPHLLRDLEQEGALSGKEEIIEQIRTANERLLSSRANYCSADEMVTHLRAIGFSSIKEVDESLYYHNAWMICAIR